MLCGARCGCALAAWTFAELLGHGHERIALQARPWGLRSNGGLLSVLGGVMRQRGCSNTIVAKVRARSGEGHAGDGKITRQQMCGRGADECAAEARNVERGRL
eukprot:13883003-Alexandrium_andersonii.AAC.1